MLTSGRPTFWAIDIYNEEKLSAETMTTSQTNRDDVYKKDTDGYSCVLIPKAFNSKIEGSWNTVPPMEKPTSARRAIKARSGR